MGLHLPAQGRKRGQASFQSHSQAPWLKTTLVQCAWSAARTKGSYLQPSSTTSERDAVQKAIVAVAASILPSITCLRTEPCIRTSAATTTRTEIRSRQKGRLLKRLTDLGFAVEPVPLTAEVSP